MILIASSLCAQWAQGQPVDKIDDFEMLFDEEVNELWAEGPPAGHAYHPAPVAGGLDQAPGASTAVLRETLFS